jgi:hypothetical protein
VTDLPDITEEQARVAFHGHLVEKATAARRRHGPVIDAATILRMLEDRAVVRYPVALHFDAAPLEPHEFASAHPLGFHSGDGFALFVHPLFADRPQDLPALVAYHIPVVNYGAIVDAEAAELYGAALLDLEPDEYYARLCALADEIAAAREPGAGMASAERPHAPDGSPR